MRWVASIGATLAVLISTTNVAASESLGVDSLRARFGARPAEALLGAAALESRVRGLERLGALGTPRAVVRLTLALTPGTLAATAEERLTAVRAVAPYAGDPAVRRCLSGVAAGHTLGGKKEGRSLDDLSRRTAALVLARTRTPDAEIALGRGLSAGGRTAEIAREALVAEPPRDATTLLGVAAPGPALVQVLAAMGNGARRALRTLVRDGAPAVRAAALPALHDLGDPEATELALRWQDSARRPEEHIAAARILSASHRPEATRAVQRLLENPDTSDAGLALAIEFPDPGLVPALAALFGNASAEQEARVVIALGRAGSAESARVLGEAARVPSRALLAFEALARMPGPAALAVLGTALSDAATRRLAVQACTFRSLIHGEVPQAFSESVRVLAASASTDDRDVAMLATALRGSDRIADLSKPPLRALLSNPEAAGAVPTTALVTPAESGGPASLLALRELAARDDDRLRPRLVELLASPDALVRRHVAFGLGRSTMPDATGLLADAARFESNPGVREAIARALSLRPKDWVRDRALRVSSELDPEPSVRTLSSRALSGERLDVDVRGNVAAWIRVLGPLGKPAPAGTPVQLATVGVYLPYVTGPDGVVLAAGLAEGPLEVRVAPGFRTVNDGR